MNSVPAADTDDAPQPPFEAYVGAEPYVFVSYAHEDSRAVYPELDRFNQLGYRVWYDEGIDPGNEWPEEVARALANCALFLVFISPRAARSRNVRNEISYALQREKTFIAVYLEETELPPGLALRMGDIQAVPKYRMSEGRYRRQLEKALPAHLIGRQPQAALVTRPTAHTTAQADAPTHADAVAPARTEPDAAPPRAEPMPVRQDESATPERSLRTGAAAEKTTEQLERAGAAASATSDVAGAARPAALPAIEVLAPKGGEVWACGTQQDIRWAVETKGSTQFMRFELKLVQADREVATISTQVLKGGERMYRWDVPRTLPEAKDYKVKVVVRDKHGQRSEAVSAGSLSIVKVAPTEKGAAAGKTAAGGNVAAGLFRVAFGLGAASLGGFIGYYFVGSFVAYVLGRLGVIPAQPVEMYQTYEASIRFYCGIGCAIIGFFKGSAD